MIFIIHPVLGIIVFTAALTLAIIAFINHKMTHKLNNEVLKTTTVSNYIVDSISRNCEVIEAMGMKNRLINNWFNTNQSHIANQEQLSSRSFVISNISKFIRMVVQSSMTGVGAFLTIHNQMSSGGIIASSILSGKALAPFDAAITVYQSILGTKKSYNRLLEHLGQDLINTDDKITLQGIKGDIELNEVFYKSGDRFIIKGISAKINAGEAIGVIGPSGAGKTTLARLILGISTPTRGSVRIDSAEISDQNKEDIGRYLGYLPQSIELFEATIKQNIARMHEDLNDMNKKVEIEQIVIDVAKKSYIHDMILRFESGYETVVTPKALSTGQRQRIALARAFFANPKVVVLDEPNSNLDTEGEVALTRMLKTAKQEKLTTITISHRPSILQSVDKIMVLQDGQIKMFDSAKNVIEQLSKPNNKAIDSSKSNNSNSLASQGSKE